MRAATFFSLDSQRPGGGRKSPPRVVENSTQAFGKSHQGSGKLQNLYKPCDYTFLDQQVSEEKLKK